MGPDHRHHKKVEILPVSAAAMWQAVATGDYYAKAKDKVVNLGVIVRRAKLGLVVPQYVTIDTIPELEKNEAKFKKKIIVIDPGAGLMRKTEQAITAYHLKGFNLIEGSDATMTAALADAIRHKEWIVVTGWTPHWMFGRWHLKYLADPKGALGGEETINAIVRKRLEKDRPEVYAFLSRYKLPLNTLQALMAANKALIDSWFK